MLTRITMYILFAREILAFHHGNSYRVSHREVSMKRIFLNLAFVLIGLAAFFVSSPAQAQYVDNGNGTVTDHSTGLVWEKAGSASIMTWEAALAWCEGVTTGGYPDWRLPNMLELRILVDDSRVNPAIDPAFSQQGLWYAYWSGTTYNGNPIYAWYVNFDTGESNYNGKGGGMAYVRCVRGGQGAFAPGAVDMLLLDGE
jgi:hypothetical protein